jgi:hypothetical protein
MGAPSKQAAAQLQRPRAAVRHALHFEGTLTRLSCRSDRSLMLQVTARACSVAPVIVIIADDGYRGNQIDVRFGSYSC